MAVSKSLGLVATLAELEDFYKGQAAGDIIELMNQTNDILSDVPWMESNQSDGHLTRIRIRPAGSLLAPPVSGYAAQQVPVEPG